MNTDDLLAIARMQTAVDEERRRQDRAGHSVEYIRALDQCEALQRECLSLFTRGRTETDFLHRDFVIQRLGERIREYGMAREALLFWSTHENNWLVCVAHEDCRTTPTLGAECWRRRRDGGGGGPGSGGWDGR